MLLLLRVLATLAFACNVGAMIICAIFSDYLGLGVASIAAGVAGALYLTIKEQHMNKAAGYRDIATRLRWEIREEHAYAPGTQLPPHAELAARFGTTRTTMRRALQVLADDGLIEIRHGQGTYVTGGHPSRTEAIEADLRRKAALKVRIERAESIANTWSVSNTTAANVLRKLTKEKIIKKRGDGSFEST